MRRLRSPALAVLLLAPFFGESLSGATSPLDLLLPWNLAFFVALYGCGALLCREWALRRGSGIMGLLWLGAAYGVYEEALVDRFWFSPTAWQDLDIGRYSVVWQTNVLVAAHLTVFHVLVSVGGSVLLVERLFPAARGRPWVGPRGQVIAAVALLVTAGVYGELGRGPAGPQLAALALCLGFVALGSHRRAAVRVGRVPRRLGTVAFVCWALHFGLTYALPQSGLPGAAGVGLALVPIAVGALVLWRAGVAEPVVWRAITGVLVFFALLDVLVGLAGRPDLLLWGLLVLAGLWRLRGQERSAAVG